MEAFQPPTMDDVRKYWPMVSRGLMAVLEKCPSMVLWPEDFYAEIKAGSMKIMICTVNGEYEGFMVVGTAQQPDGQSLHVWAMHHAGDDPDFSVNAVSIFDQLARLVNAKRVTFVGRAGWLKEMARHGYRLMITTHYTLERQ